MSNVFFAQEQSLKMAKYFCEEERTFNVDEFLGGFLSFLEKVLQCRKVSLSNVILPDADKC